MAKEEIYTIPLWDAIRSDDECPFCFIHNKLEQDLIDFCLSDAYMESDFRQVTNKIGFCKNHYTKLYNSTNKLGLNLVNQSHIMEMMEVFDKATKSFSSGKSGLFSKKQDKDSPLDKLLHTITDECYICNRVDTTMERYFETFFYLYKKEKEFRDHLLETKGFCMPHYLQLIKIGQSYAHPKLFKEFLDDTLPLFKDNMNRLLDDMQWFVNKYDYRYQDEPWKNAKDAPKRSIQMINGTKLEQ